LNLTGSDPQTQARLSIARGEKVFNEVKFNITGVAGLNTQGRETIAGNCATCHNTPNAGNHSTNVMMDIGVTGAGPNAPPALDIADMPVFNVVCTAGNLSGKVYHVTDLGRAMVTGLCEDIGKTKVPVLRALPSRSPYFHNGAAHEIDQLIDFYDQRFSIGLTDQQKADLNAFLESL